MSARQRNLWVRIGELAVSHWWSCCPEIPPGPCACSLSSDGAAPCCFRVTIAGIANAGTCQSCTNLNRSYNLSQTEENSCVWECPYVCPLLTGYSCPDRGVTWTARLTVSDEGSNQYKITVEIGPHSWSKTYDGKPSLSDLSDSLDWLADTGSCNSSSSTCAVAATDLEGNFHTCSCSCVDCGHCSGDDGANEMEVVISGVQNDGCSGCANANGTWILKWNWCDTSFCYDYDPAPRLGAAWNYEYGKPDICPGDTYSGVSMWLGLKYDSSAHTRTIALNVTSSSTAGTSCRGFTLWKTVAADGPWDCWNLSETLDGSVDNHDHFTKRCDTSNAVIQVTAIV